MLLTQDQEMIRDAVRAFAQTELWPQAARWDKEHTFPHDVHQGLAALGAYGICVPEDLGGAGLDYLSLALVLEEIAAGDGGIRQTGQVGAEQRAAWQHAGAGQDCLVDRDGAERPGPGTGNGKRAEAGGGVRGETQLQGRGRLPARRH